MIEVKELRKAFRVFERPSGLRAALRSLWHREYKSVEAVKGISFQISPGERVGFLGPNGAGKTTTLKMLSGLLHPTSGTLSVGGHLPALRRPAFLRDITLVMGQKQQLLWDLPPSETFDMNAAVYGLSREESKRQRDELVALLQIEKVINKPTRQLSLGERMRCELVAALLHRPKVLFLDEPTIGLDVSMQLSVREFVRTYNERTGATVMLTSHYMNDVLALCPRVIVIDNGQLRYDGSLEALLDSLRPKKRLSVRLAAPIARESIEHVGEVIEFSSEKFVLDVERAEVRSASTFLLGLPAVSDFGVEDPPLEEAMRSLFAEQKVVA